MRMVAAGIGQMGVTKADGVYGKHPYPYYLSTTEYWIPATDRPQHHSEAAEADTRP
jgi:hypothetical protein